MAELSVMLACNPSDQRPEFNSDRNRDLVPIKIVGKTLANLAARYLGCNLWLINAKEADAPSCY